ncbi:alpha/beta hydrolase [Motiliproteus sp. SC1-56]|uniref:alpha/beta hydrolase n=1 Tax=Motiliproteus sp. SC1-56 TaxID=2799565 RepID=UPI001A8E3314|nr:alpha/beta fold hydrolase [Motiliproteus sp. SC1-56]
MKLSTLLYLVAAGIGLFTLLCLLALLFQEQLLFQTRPLEADERQRLRAYEVAISRPGAVLRGWYLPAGDPQAPLLIYYGGNGEEIAWNSQPLSALGVSVLLINYRGYGDSEGRPSAELLKQDALAVLDQVTVAHGIPLNRVVLMGRSLGSGVATFVAHQRPVAGVILVTPYDTLSNAARHHYPWLPVTWLLRHRFDSLALAPHISQPLLNLLAGRDREVPAALGERLGDAWGGEETRVRFREADHLDIHRQGGYWKAIDTFLRQVTPWDGATMANPR